MLSNNVIKIITSLGSKKYRQKYNLFVVEGVKNIGEVIKSSINIKELFIIEDFWPEATHIKKTFIEEKDLNAETLQGQIVSLYANPVVYEQTHEHALQMGKPNAAYDIIDLLKNICKKGN